MANIKIMDKRIIKMPKDSPTTWRIIPAIGCTIDINGTKKEAEQELKNSLDKLVADYCDCDEERICGFCRRNGFHQ